MWVRENQREFANYVAYNKIDRLTKFVIEKFIDIQIYIRTAQIY